MTRTKRAYEPAAPSDGRHVLVERRGLRGVSNGRLRTGRRLDQHCMDILKPGMPAPSFTLRSAPDRTLRLAAMRGRPVVLTFYPADWSPVCGDQLALYSEVLPEFRKYGAELLGISVDSEWCHAAFARDRRLRFPLLADFEPKGAVARRYGVYRYQDGTSERALFVIDGDGTIRWSYCSPIDVNPGADGILNALELLTAAPAKSRP